MIVKYFKKAGMLCFETNPSTSATLRPTADLRNGWKIWLVPAWFHFFPAVIQCNLDNSKLKGPAKKFQLPKNLNEESSHIFDKDKAKSSSFSKKWLIGNYYILANELLLIVFPFNYCRLVKSKNGTTTASLITSTVWTSNQYVFNVS
jgi:hypothetical protein